VEFALVLPILLLMLFSVLEGALSLFTIDTARYAAGEAARQDSESGTNSNADTLAVNLIRNGPLSTTSLATVTHVDFVHLILQSNGTFTEDAALSNSYRLDGTVISSTWPPVNRNVRSGTSDFLRVKIFYQYNWLSGKVLGTGPLALTQTFDVRLEPQSY
jgi:Flp pilus assembly protein TadG